MTDAVDEHYFRTLGIHRVAVPIPFVEAGGPVNVYFLENKDDTLTMFDSGLGTPEAEASLRQSAKEANLRLDKVTRILVSHGHIDHYGLAQTIAEESGATVFVHPRDWQKVCGKGRWVEQLPKYQTYFEKLAVPKELMEGMLKLAHSRGKYARRVDEERAKPLNDGDTFELKHFTAKVMHLPGHTPGLVCLYDAANKIFFADDHLLARVSPNPLLELGEEGESDKFRSLSTYFQSARKAYDLEIDWVLPGHGPPFQGHRTLLDRLFAFYEKRQNRIVERLTQSSATAIELVEALFGKTDPLRLYLTLSEVIGNVEVLEENSRVRRELKDGIYQFVLA